MADRILGAILAGGQSRRFGSDKAVAMWRGRTLIEHAAETLASVVDEIVICGRVSGPSRAIVDRPEGGRGPLAGLNAALHWGAEYEYDRMLSIGSDTPRVPDGLLEQLIATGGPAFALECPIIGCWPTALAPDLDHFLATDPKCSFNRWAAFVDARGLGSSPIMNVNTPEDLVAAK